MTEFPESDLFDGAETIGLKEEEITKLLNDFKESTVYLPEERQLISGDLGFDNVIVGEDKQVYLIDHSSMGYGDWLFDYARLEFWWPGRHTDVESFAKKYQFNADNLYQRLKAYNAFFALTTVKWSVEAEASNVQEWLKDNIERFV